MADELSDTSLAASFPLHTASPAASSSRLHEISEDGEDPGSVPRPKQTRAKSSTGSIFGTRQYKMEKRVEQLMRSEQRPTPAIHINGDSTPTVSSPLAGGPKPSMTQLLVREDSGKRSISSLASPPSIASFAESVGSSVGSDTSATTAKETETIPSMPEFPKAAESPVQETPASEEVEEPAATLPTPASPEPPRERPASTVDRKPSMTSERSVERPSTSMTDASSISERPKPPSSDEPFDFSYLEPKPKVKLGPRPVAASERSRRSQQGAAGISALPAGYRPAAKKPEQQRPKSQGPVNYNHAQMLANMPAPPPIPDTPEYNPRPLSRGSVKSLPSQKSATMTPEKARLMKAVELRKKQLRKSNPQAQKLVDGADLSAPAVPAIPDASVMNPTQEIPKPVYAVSAAMERNQSLGNKSDSGIQMEYGEGGNASQDSGDIPKSDAQTAEPANHESEPATALSDTLRSSEAPSDKPRDTGDAQTVAPETTLSASDESNERQADETRESLRIDTSRPPSPKPTKALPVAKHLQSGSVDSPTLGRDTDVPAFSSSLDHLITDVPTIVTTASSRPPTAPEATSPVGDAKDAVSQSEENMAASEGLQNSGNLPLPGQETEAKSSDLAKRRRGIVEPLHIDVETGAAAEEGEIGSDDELFEELQSATLHEAQPMSVSRSPGPNAQFFRRPSSLSVGSARSQTESPQTTYTSNVVSNNTTESSEAQPQQPAERETSSASPEPHHQPRPVQPRPTSTRITSYERPDPMAGLRRNVSSGISTRWKALSENSTRENSPVAVRQPTRPLTPDQKAEDMLVAQPRPALRSPRSRTSSYRGRRAQDRSSISSTGFSQPELTPIWSTTQDGTSNRDSVSVKARIVRGPTLSEDQQATEGALPERQPLHESRIEINHTRGIPTPTPVSQAFLPPLETTPAAAPSKRDSTEQQRTLHSATSRRKSWGRNRILPSPTPAADEIPVPPFSPKNVSSSGSASIISDDASAPASSRTSRFFKRMSNFGTTNKRRSVTAQSVGSITSTDLTTPRNGSVAPAVGGVEREKDRSDMPPAVAVGDLNVQFPDTLVSSSPPPISPLH